MSIDSSKAFAVISENIAENSAELSRKLEMRIGIAGSEIALAKRSNKLDPGEAELMSMYKNNIFEASRIKPGADTPGIFGRHLEIFSSAVSVADSVSMSRMMLENLKDAEDFSRYDLLEPDQTGTAISDDIRIVYRKAHGADIAFEKFASLIPDAAAVYRDTFPAVCDAVALGYADMCILPYENTEDGKLGSFYRLIDSYDLKIAASSLVRSDRREDMTRYLLLSRSLVGLSMLSGVTDFEFSFADRSDGTLTRTLAAAYLLKLNVRSIDTVKSEKNVTVYDIRVTADERALDEFILYLKLEEVDFSPLGLYAVID